MCEIAMPEIGDRVRLERNSSIKGVVQYCGIVSGTSGIWVGVDWDDKNRGKHDGSLNGNRYFTARYETSGSFVRPNALVLGSELVQQLLEKYADEPISDTIIDRWELMLEKTYDKQKNIFSLNCIVLINSTVSHISVTRCVGCFNQCVELDLTGTLVSRWAKLLEILEYFPALNTLHLNNTRMEALLPSMMVQSNLPPIKQISLQNAFLSLDTANSLTKLFSHIEEIYLGLNDLTSYSPLGHVNNLRWIDLQQNRIASMSQVSSLQSLPRLEYLNMSECSLRKISFENHASTFPSLKALHIRENPISEWKFIDELARLPQLNKLMVNGSSLPEVAGLEVRDLIIAKMPKLIDLDRCDISEVERRSLERYALKRLSESGAAAVDLSHADTIKRLEQVHGITFEKNETQKVVNNAMLANSKNICLQYKENRVQRVLSLLLSVHRVVCMASKLLKFDPDNIAEVAIKRNGFSAERVKRTKDTLLSIFNLDDGDTIAFLSDDCLKKGENS